MVSRLGGGGGGGGESCLDSMGQDVFSTSAVLSCLQSLKSFYPVDA